jgi:probable phosphoglycerate mutase
VRIALVRHGQTDWNAAGLFQGSSDTPLNDVGRAQAAESAARLTAQPWDAVVSSPLSRARETAAIIADVLGIPLGAAYPELVERDYGPFEGTPSLDSVKSDPRIEPLTSVVQRGHAALARIGAEHPGGLVLAIAHGTIIRYTLSDLVGWRVPVPLNGSIAEVEADPPSWRVLLVNGAPLEPELSDPAPDRV